MEWHHQFFYIIWWKRTSKNCEHCTKNHTSQVHGKLKKTQADFIFPSTFWLKKDRISHHGKIQNKNFPVIGNYDLSINFLPQKKDRISRRRKVQNKKFSVISKCHFSIYFLAQKIPYFPSLKSSKQELFSNQ